MRKNKDVVKIKVALSKKNYKNLKKYEKEKINSVINQALDMYFNKDFCAKELERNAILGMGVLDESK